MELYEGQDKGPNTSEIQKLRIDINKAVDILITEIYYRFEKLMKVAGDSGFLTGESLQNMSTTESKKAAINLAIKYG